jgi:hypothetical protein
MVALNHYLHKRLAWYYGQAPLCVDQVPTRPGHGLYYTALVRIGRRLGMVSALGSSLAFAKLCMQDLEI